MSLIIQIKTIIVSFLFGIFSMFFFLWNKKLLYNTNKYIRLISTIIIYILLIFLYFAIILKINNGYFHIYELLFIFIGILTIALKYKK